VPPDRDGAGHIGGKRGRRLYPDTNGKPLRRPVEADRIHPCADPRWLDQTPLVEILPTRGGAVTTPRRQRPENATGEQRAGAHRTLRERPIDSDTRFTD